MSTRGVPLSRYSVRRKVHDSGPAGFLTASGWTWVFQIIMGRLTLSGGLEGLHFQGWREGARFGSLLRRTLPALQFQYGHPWCGYPPVSPRGVGLA